MLYRDYFKRIEDAKGFRQELYNKKITGKSLDRKIACLFEDCFSNHVDFHDPHIISLEHNHESVTRYINQDVLSAYFINKVYEIPTIQDYDNDDVINYTEYMYKTCETSFTENATGRFRFGSNRVRYVVGDVGSGKSAFMKRLICDIRNSEIIDNEYTVVPVHINLEENYNYGLKPIPLMTDFIVYLYRRIEKEVEDQVADLNRTELLSICPVNDPLMAVKRLVHELKKQKIRLVIFIDNLDFYHYFYARYSIFDEYNSNQTRSVHENIMWLISMFSNAEALGHLGLNVLIAARTYIYDEIASDNHGINTSIDTTQAITLQIPSEDTIVSSRLKLLGEAIAVVGQEKKGAGSNLQEMLTSLETSLLGEKISGKNMSNMTISSIYRLGQHGYRSLVHFLSSLSLSYMDRELLDRFLVRQARSLYILYTNNMYRLYSQKQDHFPNMFLVDCTVIEGEGFELAHQPHMHTYWLKYFILRYIYENDEVRLGDVLDTFIVKGGYDDHLVRHVIGSLCTANEFRCAEVDTKDFNRPMRSRKIKATERGKAMFRESFGVEFCFQFTYLQTIIDDQWLCYPERYFYEIYDENSDFIHLYYQGGEYIRNTVSEVISKAKKILWFLNVLEMSYYEEVRKRKIDLDKILINLNLVPDFNFLSTQIILDAKGIIESLNVELSKEDMESIRKVKFDLGNNFGVRDFFDKYYASGVKVSN